MENEFTETPREENKMGVMPIPKLILTMSLPMIISMLVQAMYNVVDSIFVSRVNENALTAVSLAFPIQHLMIAVASGTGVASTRCSQGASVKKTTSRRTGPQTTAFS